jgi:hypothetical protein
MFKTFQIGSFSHYSTSRILYISYSKQIGSMATLTDRINTAHLETLEHIMQISKQSEL